MKAGLVFSFFRHFLYTNFQQLSLVIEKGVSDQHGILLSHGWNIVRSKTVPIATIADYLLIKQLIRNK